MLEDVLKIGYGFLNICNIYHLLNVFISIAFPLVKLTPKLSDLIFGMDKRSIDTV
jgi:hypothetical protein